jgi:hypothetical protein
MFCDKRRIIQLELQAFPVFFVLLYDVLHTSGYAEKEREKEREREREREMDLLSL